jgi:hypothetical protein
MYLLTVVLYPIALALLCTGAGLLVDRVSGSILPGALVPLVGMAALVGLTQLSTWLAWLAPASPGIVAVVAVAGFFAGRVRASRLLARLRAGGSAAMQISLTVLAYLIAIAPVLAGGRPSFSAYMVLTDSSIHMVGADYLMSHGFSFAHLDLSNSYGQLVNSYFPTGYPTGADTLFGASAFLLGLPMIWAFQPFNAFALAMAAGPAWLLVRRIGLNGFWAALAALSATVPALVYAYELIASVKEIVALAMLLGIGALIAADTRWLARGARGAIPFALLCAAGISALGLGFGAWVAMSLVVLALTHRSAIADLARTSRQAAAPLAGMAFTVVLFSLPTWAQASKALSVTQTIASTSDPGNLQQPLRPVQMVGTWLTGSYLSPPHGLAAAATYALVALTVLAAAIGVAHLVIRRRTSLVGWLIGSSVVWLALTAYGTRWVDAKALVLTSPVLILAAWAGVAAVRGASARIGMRVLAPAMATMIAGGVLLSDAIQYHDMPLAPTARYDEMASLNARFAGRGPTLFADFDEYSLYEMRSMDIGGPDFLNVPPALLQTSKGHGHTVDLELAKPAALARYPLVVTRVSPMAFRPPAAYRLLWRGTYYQVWGRIHGAQPAIVAMGLHSSHPVGCRLMGRLAGIARAHHAQLVADSHPQAIQLGLHRLHHSAGWYPHTVEFVMDGEGRLWSNFSVPRAGVYQLWLQGEAMPALQVKIDGRQVASVGGQVSGNGDSPDPLTPIRVSLRAGQHTLSIVRGGFSLAPGAGSEAYLQAIYFTPAGFEGQQHLQTVSPARWRSLCGARLDWIEVVPSSSGGRQPLRRQRA